MKEDRGIREAQPSQSRKSHGGRRTPHNSAAHDNEDQDDEDDGDDEDEEVGYDEDPNGDAQAHGPRRYSKHRPAATGNGYPGFPDGGRGPAPRGNGNTRRSIRAHRSRDPEDDFRDGRNRRRNPGRQAGRRQDHHSHARVEEDISTGGPRFANPIRRREDTDTGRMDWADMDEQLLTGSTGRR